MEDESLIKIVRSKIKYFKNFKKTTETNQPRKIMI